MRRISRGRFGLALALGIGLTTATGCSDRLPTIVDSGRFPPGLEPVTIEYVLGTSEFLTSAFALRGDTDIFDSSDLVIANQFDGVLDAHVLAEFATFPDTVVVPGSDEGAFQWVDAEIRTVVLDSVTSAPAANFYLWMVTQAWDSTATWTHASTSPTNVPWQEPGGTRGELLAVAGWERSDTTAAGDSLVWVLGPGSVEMIAAVENPSFLVTVEDPNVRTQIRPLTIQLSLVPVAAPDSVQTRNVAPVHQAFIISEGPPPLPDLLSAGGITSDRSLLQMMLPDMFPGCPDDSCPMVAATDIVLNRVDLVVDPAPVTGGFRPLGPYTVLARQLFEPELGVQAPLGPVVSAALIPPDRFAPGGSVPVSFIITGPVSQALASGDLDFGLALSVEPRASQFSYAWFSLSPRLRFIYTLRQTPELP